MLAEVDQLGASEIVLVAQDLASYGRDQGRGERIVPLVEAVAARVPRSGSSISIPPISTTA